MPDRLFILITGLIIGIIWFIIATFFGEKKQKNSDYRQSSGKSPGSTSGDQEFCQMKQELKRLQAEIDKVNGINASRKACSTIDSGYDFQTACEELDITDCDLLNEWNRRDSNFHNSCEEAVKLQERLNDIDKMLDSDNTQEIKRALEQLKDLCFNNPEEVELLYRIGRAHVRLSEGQPDDIVKNHVEKGINALLTALNLNVKHSEVHKWYAILLGLRCQFQSIQDKARDGFLIKKHCDMACALNTNDPVIHHILGRFHYEIAGLGWFERKIAGSIVGESLDSTYSDALKHFMTAEKLSERQHLSTKEKIENKTMIANTLVNMDKKKDAEKWFTEAEHLKSFGLNNIDKMLDSDNNQEITRALEQLTKLCFNNPKEVELLYRIGKAHVRLSEGQSDVVVKNHAEKGINALLTALSLNVKHSEVHKWYAILLGLRIQFQSIEDKARDGFLIKKHGDLACALNPNDPVIHHILGRFHYEIAGLGWLERKIAESIVGESLDSTYSDALEKFMTAEKLSGWQHLNTKEKLENKSMIAKTLVNMGKKKDAEKWFKEAEHLKSFVF